MLKSIKIMSKFLVIKFFFIFSLIGILPKDVKANDNKCPEDCGENAFCNPCGDHCEKFCSDTQGKPCARICLPAACQCNEKYVRDDVTKKCVLKEDCSAN